MQAVRGHAAERRHRDGVAGDRQQRAGAVRVPALTVGGAQAAHDDPVHQLGQVGADTASAGHQGGGSGLHRHAVPVGEDVLGGEQVEVADLAEGLEVHVRGEDVTGHQRPGELEQLIGLQHLAEVVVVELGAQDLLLHPHPRQRREGRRGDHGVETQFRRGQFAAVRGVRVL